MFLPSLLKHFILFYFLLNSIIVFIALKYDCPKYLIEEKEYWVIAKAMLKLFLGGIVFVLIGAVRES